MSYVGQTHGFFKETVYSNLVKFAACPVSWAFDDNKLRDQTSSNPSLEVTSLCIEFACLSLKGVILLLASPILIPAAVITSALALCTAGVAAIAHVISLAVAGVVDFVSHFQYDEIPSVLV